jgi:hypothetical protein
MIRLLAHPLPPPSPMNKLSLFLSLPVYRRSSLLTGGREWWARSQIIRPRESLAVYKSFNTFCSTATAWMWANKGTVYKIRLA